MYRKKDNAGRETRCSGGAEPPTGSYKASAERVVGCGGSRRGSYDRLRVWDNITGLEGRDPALFTQATSRGSGDCDNAINSEHDQDATAEALSQGQARKAHAL